MLRGQKNQTTDPPSFRPPILPSLPLFPTSNPHPSHRHVPNMAPLAVWGHIAASATSFTAFALINHQQTFSCYGAVPNKSLSRSLAPSLSSFSSSLPLRTVPSHVAEFVVTDRILTNSSTSCLVHKCKIPIRVCMCWWRI